MHVGPSLPSAVLAEGASEMDETFSATAVASPETDETSPVSTSVTVPSKETYLPSGVSLSKFTSSLDLGLDASCAHPSPDGGLEKEQLRCLCCFLLVEPLDLIVPLAGVRGVHDLLTRCPLAGDGVADCEEPRALPPVACEQLDWPVV